MNHHKELAPAALSGQDNPTPTQPEQGKEGDHVRIRRATPQSVVSRNQNRRGLPAKPEYQPFADALRAAMQRRGITASELARQVWGSTTDKRGYSVARNRDRVGHYLAGASYPEPMNLDLIAKALDVPIEELAIAPAEGSNPGARRVSVGGAQGQRTLTEIPGRPDRFRLQVDQILDWELAMEIMQKLKRALIEDLPIPGTAIDGGKPDNDDGDGDKPEVA